MRHILHALRHPGLEPKLHPATGGTLARESISRRSASDRRPTAATIC
jgi:hypothetical protein